MKEYAVCMSGGTSSMRMRAGDFGLRGLGSRPKELESRVEGLWVWDQGSRTEGLGSRVEKTKV
eukprot:379435-Rhodomonas_salina.1